MNRTSVKLFTVAAAISVCAMVSFPDRCYAPPQKFRSGSGAGSGASDLKQMAFEAIAGILLEELIIPAAMDAFDKYRRKWNEPDKKMDVVVGESGEAMANREKIGAWELFTLEPGHEDFFALKFHTGYLSPMDGGKTVVANRKQIGALEYWQVQVNNDKTVSIRSRIDRYLCAEGGGGGKLAVDRKIIGEWEKFRLVKCGKTNAGHEVFALRSWNGKYVSAQP